MNEDARTELTRLLAPPDGPELPADRGRLMRGHLMNQFARGPAAVPRRSRLGWVALPALAGGLALSLVLVGGSAEPGPGAGPGIDSTRPVAAVVLDRAARAVEQQPVPAARGDQFVYVKSLDDWAKSEGGAPREREVWRSVDGGKRDLLLLNGQLPNPGGGDDHEPPGEPAPFAGIGSYAYAAALPTDPEALLAKIHADTAGQGPGPDEEAFRTIGDILREQIAPSAVSAALYRAAAKIPGVTVIDSVTDAAGRPGVAVARVDGGGKVESQWIFDQADYTFRGERTVVATDNGTFKKGDVTGQMAVLVRAVVDEPGVRP
ncbi:CU044_5270 family protein [Kitasatospora sp. SUK 42]|uniref:CU044_5270 family protein n=1 Tax=Kitasatospora sp. SUK 42 TaxID=1588882 RepID=UPI0018CBD877|nr:CU044_5270 family protein [Kitasatospora sp. SUK 42]MBV2154210.1 CU044_5270 family protein [Kitasatospora sp. SUK 42]